MISSSVASGFPEADVVAHGSLFDPGILQHHTKAAAERMAGQLVDRLSVDADLSGIDIIEAHQQVDKRRLSASGRADNGNTHARLYVKIKVLDQFFLFVITECYIIDRHISRSRYRSFRPGLHSPLSLPEEQKIRPAQASAFCISVITELISLNGFIYWFAYDSRTESPPTVSAPPGIMKAPTKGNTGIDHVVDKTGGRVR